MQVTGKRWRLKDRVRTPGVLPIGLLAVGAIALALTAAPVSLTITDGDIVIVASKAEAKGGNGGGNGGGKNKGDKGVGHGKSGKGANGLGPGHRGKAKGRAMDRYDKALAGLRGQKSQGNGRDFGSEAYQLNTAEAEALIGHGWGAYKKELDDGFRNHGERVNFYKDIAEALGLPNHFGAMWANFGDPTENGVLALQAALSEAENEHQAAHLQAKLDAAIDNAKPGNGPKSGWETVDIDLDNDGDVDEIDLEMALGENVVEESGGEE